MTRIHASDRVANVLIFAVVVARERRRSAEIIANQSQQRLEPKVVDVDVFVLLLSAALWLLIAHVRVDLMQPTAAALVLLVLPHGSNALLEESQIACLIHHRRRVHVCEHRPKVLHIRHVHDLFDILGPVRCRWSVVSNVAVVNFATVNLVLNKNNK